MKKVIFVDRDGTIIREPADEQVDSMEKLSFVPGAISGLRSLTGLGYELVLATNQDGLGTASFPEEDFLPPHRFMIQTLLGEGVSFSEELIDKSFEWENAPTRKPRTGMFGAYMDGSYDLAASFVIGDRETDMILARSLGCRGLQVGPMSWDEIVRTIRSSSRCAKLVRNTGETSVKVVLDLDGGIDSHIDTGLKFFDHMLEQLPHHGGIGLQIECRGDLQVDEHHTMEDVGIVLGEAFSKALQDKTGLERYGFALPMDESRAAVLLDFGGRSELVWDVEFTREYVGDTPTEMFKHFFKSLCSAAQCNIHISAAGENNHHIAEAVFKAFARAVKNAVRRDVFTGKLPSSKGLL